MKRISPLLFLLFPDGRKDDTYLSTEGANVIAGIVAGVVERMKTPLARHVKQH